MLNNRIVRLASSLAATIFLMTIIVLAKGDSDSRILTMMGADMPAGLIQAATYFLFFWGMFEIVWLNSRVMEENDAFKAHLLPEKDNWVLSPEDVNQLKLNMQHLERHNKFLMTDLIKKSCTKYRLSKSSSEVLELVEAQTEIYQEEIESEQSFIRYVAWAIPSVGFIGTVIGIAASLGYADEANTPEGISKVTDMLAIAFDTTLVALILSIILMLGIHSLQRKEDKLFADMKSYVIENLINRFYKQ